MEKRKEDILFFDLDGTIINSAEGIINCVAYSAEKLGQKAEDRKALEVFIGPPLREMFHEYFGFTGEDLKNAVLYYRQRYETKGILENELYPGIADTLAYLKEKGKKLVLATSKPEKFAREILEEFGILSCFDFVAGASLDETRNQKEEVIEYAMEKMKITDRKRVLMIGDRKYDVIGAHKTGIKCMGVLYGFGSKEELKKAGADMIVESVEKMRESLV